VGEITSQTDRPTIERRNTTQTPNTGTKDNSSSTSPPLQTTLRSSTEADLSTTSIAPPHPTSSSSSSTAHTQKRSRPSPMYHQERPMIGYTMRDVLDHVARGNRRSAGVDFVLQRRAPARLRLLESSDGTRNHISLSHQPLPTRTETEEGRE
jgi:hypothetical protein